MQYRKKSHRELMAKHIDIQKHRQHKIRTENHERIRNGIIKFNAT